MLFLRLKYHPNIAWPSQDQVSSGSTYCSSIYLIVEPSLVSFEHSVLNKLPIPVLISLQLFRLGNDSLFKIFRDMLVAILILHSPLVVVFNRFSS